jgi:hypothetical protein
MISPAPMPSPSRSRAKAGVTEVAGSAVAATTLNTIRADLPEASRLVMVVIEAFLVVHRRGIASGGERKFARFVVLRS